MTRKFHFLPLAIVMMSLVLGIKVVDFSFGIEASIAETGSLDQTAPEQEAPGAEDPAAVSEQNGQNPAETDDAAAENGVTQLGVSPSRKEIEYLQKLAERRQELARRARELDDRERLLEAVEKRIVERTASLKQIEQTIAGLLAKHDEREKAQLESLVKIYSAMKPKDAAQIFNNLEEGVLISIVENMKEKTMGAILAKMELNKAKDLTTRLATRKKLPKIEG